MPRYIDGFVLPVPKKKVQAYRRIATRAGKIWLEHGALEFRECMGDDIRTSFAIPFTRMARAKAGETVFFSYIVYKSRAHRDKVNAAVMKDPRILKDMDKMPFDTKRMSHGGFTAVVDLKRRRP